jgi:alkanesulfonate monooxygenase SsuD/methylene tetrahydromethanopterin reductase-like flavin-dependent oxidoreductase (luciferase family)
MRFGLFLLFEWSGPPRAFGAMYGEVLEQIQFAEEQGLEVVWLAEHHFVSYSVSPQPLMLAIKAAALTRRIRFGTGVLVLPFYHPLRVAGEVAMADVLTDGRLEIGVGRGAYPYEFARYGIPFEEARDRSQECLAIMLRAWREEDFEHRGRFYAFPRVTVLPRPLQQPHPPVWIAALSPDSFHHAVEGGHHILSTVFRDPIDKVAEKVELYRRILKDARKTEADSDLAILRIAYVAETDEAAREALPHVTKNHRTWHHLHYGTESISCGVVSSAPVDQEPSLEEAWERLIIGSPERCIRQIQALEAIGVTQLLLNMNFGNMTHHEAMRSLRLFGREVLPAFR